MYFVLSASPHVTGIIDQIPSEELRRGLMLLSKVTYTVLCKSNGTDFDKIRDFLGFSQKMNVLRNFPFHLESFLHFAKFCANF